MLSQKLCPPGYNYLGLPRVTSRGGGLGLIFKEEYDVSLYSKLDANFKSFEFLPIKVKVTYEEFLLVILYRPPPSPKNKLTGAMFLEEFNDFVGKIAIMHERIVLIGDFNIHWELPDKKVVQNFAVMLQSAGLHQHVTTATHQSGHTLDLVITRTGDSIISSCEVQNDVIADHFSINCKLELSKPRPRPEYKQIWRFHELFGKDLGASVSKF